MSGLKWRAQSAESQNQPQVRRRSTWLLWVLGSLLFLAIVVIALSPFWGGISTLTTISTVAGPIIALLALFVAILQLYPPPSRPPEETNSAFLGVSGQENAIRDDPFEWVNIPAGKVILEDKSAFDNGTKGGTYDISAFAIAKYPVTNGQYAMFVDAPDGYREQAWWGYSDEAKKWRNEHPQPKVTAFKGNDLPRTNICWYDAIAFCRWISHHTTPIITLPTEQQWQRAAQGDNNWAYPWGNKFDEKQCNSSVQKESSGPTPVTQFSNGVSQYQVMDLSGNVWEWCLTEWGTDSVNLRGSNQRVLRGGSWSNKAKDILRAAYRDKRNPDREQNNLGFRCVQSGQQTGTGA